MEYKIEVGLRQNDLEKAVSSMGDPPVGSQGSERDPSLSKLLLREEPRCGWIRLCLSGSGLSLQDTYSSSLRSVHSQSERERKSEEFRSS